MTAYKDFPMLEQSLLRLRKFGVDVFLHIDRKSTFSASEMNAISQLCVKVRSDYSVPWGGYEHLEAIVKLMQDIVRTGRHYDYVHTISGQDVIVHSLDTRPEYWDGTIYMKSIPREEFPDNVEVRIRRRNLLRRFQKWKKPWQFADFLLGKVQDLPSWMKPTCHPSLSQATSSLANSARRNRQLCSTCSSMRLRGRSVEAGNPAAR